MSHPYIFIKPEDIESNIITVCRDDSKHLLNSLRIKIGESVDVSDNKEFRYDTRVVGINKDIKLEIISKKKINRKETLITLFQCILKKNAMENVIQKTTEIGIDSIIPIYSRRTVSEPKKTESKLSRWRKISEQASKQCKRDIMPAIENPVNIADIDLEESGLFFMPYEEHPCISGMKDIRNYVDKLDHFNDGGDIKRISFIIGPEGGFDREEAGLIKDRGAILINFGKEILRAETAAVYFLSILDYLVKNSKYAN